MCVGYKQLINYMHGAENCSYHRMNVELSLRSSIILSVAAVKSSLGDFNSNL